MRSCRSELKRDGPHTIVTWVDAFREQDIWLERTRVREREDSLRNVVGLPRDGNA